jgi:hypothetical protein
MIVELTLGFFRGLLRRVGRLRTGRRSGETDGTNGDSGKQHRNSVRGWNSWGHQILLRRKVAIVVQRPF